MDGNARNRARVLISHQGCVPIYRRGLFERLGRISDIEYVVAYGDPPRGTDYLTAAEPYAFATQRITNYEVPSGTKSLVWQPLVRRFWSGFDAAILGDEIKFVSHLAIIAAAKLRGRPVILWGFGDWSERSDAEASVAGRLKALVREAIRRMLLRTVDGYLVYTRRGDATLQAAGMPQERIAVVHNTVDIDAQMRFRALAHETSEAESRRLLGVRPDGPVLVYFGRLAPWKRLDVLIDYAKQARAAGRPVTVMLCGHGRERERLEARAAGMSDVVFLTAPDDLVLARALRIATAVVVPEHVGLAITHSFAHGVPLIAADLDDHPPEIEYLTPGENGLLLPREPEAFFRGLDAFLDDADLQARLRRGAAASAARLSMDTMTAAFDGLVRRLLAKAERRRAPPPAPRRRKPWGWCVALAIGCGGGIEAPEFERRFQTAEGSATLVSARRLRA